MEFKERKDENGNLIIEAFLSEIEKRRMSMSNVLKDVINERLKQDAKWGEQNHSCLDQVLLNREGGCRPQRMCEHYEVPHERRAKFLCDTSFERGHGSYAHIAVEELSEVISQFDIVKRREELVQLTAVCVAWIEKIDRELIAIKKYI